MAVQGAPKIRRATVREQGVDKPVDNAEDRWSGGEPRAALGATAADDGPSAGRAHAFPEAVAALPATIVGLECALHEDLSFSPSVRPLCAGLASKDAISCLARTPGRLSAANTLVNRH